MSFPHRGFGIPAAAVYDRRTNAYLPVRRSSSDRAKVSELRRVADLGDVPWFGADAKRGLFLDDSSDRRWPKGNRVTALGHRDVVRSSVLAKEEPLFTLQQSCEVQAAYRHIYL